MLKNAAMIIVVVLVVLAIAAVALRGRTRFSRKPDTSAPASVRRPTFSLDAERDRRARREAARDAAARRAVERVQRAVDEQQREPGA